MVGIAWTMSNISRVRFVHRSSVNRRYVSTKLSVYDKDIERSCEVEMAAAVLANVVQNIFQPVSDKSKYCTDNVVNAGHWVAIA